MKFVVAFFRWAFVPTVCCFLFFAQRSYGIYWIGNNSLATFLALVFSVGGLFLVTLPWREYTLPELNSGYSTFLTERGCQFPDEPGVTHIHIKNHPQGHRSYPVTLYPNFTWKWFPGGGAFFKNQDLERFDEEIEDLKILQQMEENQWDKARIVFDAMTLSMSMAIIALSIFYPIHPIIGITISLIVSFLVARRNYLQILKKKKDIKNIFRLILIGMSKEVKKNFHDRNREKYYYEKKFLDSLFRDPTQNELNKFPIELRRAYVPGNKDLWSNRGMVLVTTLIIGVGVVLCSFKNYSPPPKAPEQQQKNCGC